jgi:hypothetical protein
MNESGQLEPAKVKKKKAFTVYSTSDVRVSGVG